MHYYIAICFLNIFTSNPFAIKKFLYFLNLSAEKMIKKHINDFPSKISQRLYTLLSFYEISSHISNIAAQSSSILCSATLTRFTTQSAPCSWKVSGAYFKKEIDNESSNEDNFEK